MGQEVNGNNQDARDGFLLAELRSEIEDIKRDIRRIRAAVNQIADSVNAIVLIEYPGWGGNISPCMTPRGFLSLPRSFEHCHVAMF